MSDLELLIIFFNIHWALSLVSRWFLFWRISELENELQELQKDGADNE